MGGKVVLDGELLINPRIDGELSVNFYLDGTPDKIIMVTDYDTPVYTGETTVNPDFIGRVLQTAQKTVMNNIVVNPIQVESVSNIQGGRTVYIGGII